MNIISELEGKWANPSGTAILGQPVTKPEQAPQLHPLSKISLISKGTHGIQLDGGLIDIDWREDGVWMTGATMHVFDGVLTAQFLESLQ